MSINGIHKWDPEYMQKHGLTETDIWRDIANTRAKMAFIYLISAIVGGIGLGVILKVQG